MVQEPPLHSSSTQSRGSPQRRPSVPRTPHASSICVSGNTPHDPAVHRRTVHARTATPVKAHSSAYSQGLQSPQTGAPQLVPSVSRLQGRDSGRGDEVHVPPAQMRSVQVRFSVADSSHASEYAQPLQRLQVVPPQLTPSVPRVQLSDSVRGVIAQPPAAQTGSKQVRVREPVVSHVSANPPHADHPSQLGAPHAVPSVSRAQSRVSLRSTAPHEPAVQTTSEQLRLSVPDSSQVEL